MILPMLKVNGMVVIDVQALGWRTQEQLPIIMLATCFNLFSLVNFPSEQLHYV